MLAGLLFATSDAEDRPMLAATLPVGGVTLIEYQARLLKAVGVTQLLVAVARMTPELLAAFNRLSRRGLKVDAVRTAAEAVAVLHPLARVVWLADGLMTTLPVIESLALRERDTLLVTDEAHAVATLERIGSGVRWAGAALIEPQRIEDVARLPADYDFAATLLRVTAQAQAVQLMLPDAARPGHGVERRGEALAVRGRAALATAVAARESWFDRYLLAPLARLVLPPVMERGLPGWAAAALGGGLAMIGLAVEGLWSAAAGLIVLVFGLLVLAMGEVLAWLRDEGLLARILRWSVPAGAAFGIALLGWIGWRTQGTASAPILAATLLLVATVAERAAGAAPRRWDAAPTVYPLLALPLVAAGQLLGGLGLCAAYAAIALALAVERLRQKP